MAAEKSFSLKQLMVSKDSPTTRTKYGTSLCWPVTLQDNGSQCGGGQYLDKDFHAAKLNEENPE
jgi:hypothetical protein